VQHRGHVGEVEALAHGFAHGAQLLEIHGLPRRARRAYAVSRLSGDLKHAHQMNASMHRSTMHKRAARISRRRT
jgi:hypothetical protein